jgi:DNA-3-methyladenine glycosylase I
MSDRLLAGADGRIRCWWCGTDPAYIAYHDEEWGQPVHGERELFELLTLEGFQSGLSWLTILRKRDAFRAAFAGFDVEAVAAFGPDDVERLVGDAGIVRHRGKIEATIGNGIALAALHADGRSLDDLVWSYDRGSRERALGPDDSLPATTPESTALSKELKKLGFRFVGPTTVYAFMQSAGIVDDHIAGCFCGR